MKHAFGLTESIALERCHHLIEATRPYVERHNDEIFMGYPNTTLTRKQMMELVQYRLTLGNVKKFGGFPNVSLPPAPSFCVEARALEIQFGQQDALLELESLKA